MKHGSHVALLRGINVGGKNILPMKGLAAIFVAAGCMDVKTYIQSGNVVFKAMEIDGLQAAVRAQIEAQYGLKVPVVLRNAAEIERAIASNPFIKADVAADWMHVMFIEQEPSQEQVAGRSRTISAGSVCCTGKRCLSAPAAWSGEDKADQRVLRLKADDGGDTEELANRADAGGDDGRRAMRCCAGSCVAGGVAAVRFSQQHSSFVRGRSR